MQDFDVVIVGGGPAGAACARGLNESGLEVVVLDKVDFPRDKLCAGWLTPRVFRLLGVEPGAYSGDLSEFRRLHFHFPHGIHIPFPTRQYAIRRYEFDHWLLVRSGVRFIRHHVRSIKRITDDNEESFVLDDRFRARYLVGAGGSTCPVARMAAAPKIGKADEGLLAALEAEFSYPWKNRECHLWFSEHGLPGYSWYVPKKGGYLTVGLGADVKALRRGGQSLRDYWDRFVEKLWREGFIDDELPGPRGYSYRRRVARTMVNLNPMPGVYLIGDAAGLATRDMGEGIRPAVESGLQVAEMMLIGWSRRRKIRAYSFPDFFRY